MRKLGLALSSIILCSTSLLCEQGAAHAAPQTARQALIEMLFSKTPGTFLKHLPAATRGALEKSGALKNLEQYSLIASQLQTQGKSLETFETGSVLVSTEDPKTGQRVEVIVENDALRGDEDDIELSFQTYKSGQAQRTSIHAPYHFRDEDGSGNLEAERNRGHHPPALGGSRFSQGHQRSHEGAICGAERHLYWTNHSTN